jgi:hypothetical protein
MKRRIPATASGVLASLVLASLPLAAGCTTPNPVITLGTASAPAMVAGAAPTSGRYFLTAEVTLAVPSGGTATPAWWYYYELVTEQGLAISASVDASTAIDMSCAEDVSVGPSSNYQCTLVFEVPCGQTAAYLEYEAGKAVAVWSSSNPPPVPGC